MTAKHNGFFTFQTMIDITGTHGTIIFFWCGIHGLPVKLLLVSKSIFKDFQLEYGP